MWMTIGLIIAVILAGAFLYGAYEGVQQVKAEDRAAKIKDDKVRAMQATVAAFLAKRKKLAQPAVPVTISDEVATDLVQSRFGGRPAWPDGVPYPKPKGRFPLCFLVQINLDEMPYLNGFPTGGLLQFYFAADDLYGMTFPDGQSDGPTSGSDIVVVHHPATTHMHQWAQFESADEVATLDVPFQYDDWWKTSYALAFDPVRDMKPTFGDFQIYDDYEDVRDLLPNDKQFRKYADRWSEGEPHGTVIGGHPHFTQMDPRYDYPELRDYTQVLLSMPSVQGKIMWGDVGTGSFMIKPKDLAARNFTDILYNYDCY